MGEEWVFGVWGWVLGILGCKAFGFGVLGGHLSPKPPNPDGCKGLGFGVWGLGFRV